MTTEHDPAAEVGRPMPTHPAELTALAATTLADRWHRGARTILDARDRQALAHRMPRRQLHTAALTALASGSALLIAIEAHRWPIAAQALLLDVPLDDVAVAMGMSPDDLRFGMIDWAHRMRGANSADADGRRGLTAHRYGQLIARLYRTEPLVDVAAVEQ